MVWKRGIIANFQEDGFKMQVQTLRDIGMAYRDEGGESTKERTDLDL